MEVIGVKYLTENITGQITENKRQVLSQGVWPLKDKLFILGSLRI